MSFYKRRNSWVRRRWLDFRQGHTIYLVFAMTFLNFITIQYKLLVEDIKDNVPGTLAPILNEWWIFAALFIAVYLPLAIVIGYWHRKTQWKVEQEAMFSENVVQARLWLFMMNLVEGKATEAERQKMRKMLEKIIRKLPSDSREKGDAEAA